MTDKRLRELDRLSAQDPYDQSLSEAYIREALRQEKIVTDWDGESEIDWASLIWHMSLPKKPFSSHAIRASRDLRAIPFLIDIIEDGTSLNDLTSSAFQLTEILGKKSYRLLLGLINRIEWIRVRTQVLRILAQSLPRYGIIPDFDFEKFLISQFKLYCKLSTPDFYAIDSIQIRCDILTVLGQIGIAQETLDFLTGQSERNLLDIRQAADYARNDFLIRQIREEMSP